ncbi:MAG: Aspartate carbamoyltransferase [candidate division WS2 bacterium]|nr:Aspartate carbamoyltransferase [Candidatus Lithacetigena glycinireducens]
MIRKLVNPLDLSIQEYYHLFETGKIIYESPQDFTQLANSKILATLFYEPSTRTRMSFESAMFRLGGKVLSMADTSTSSVAKGESLADTIKTISNYVDIIVIRHPKDGSAEVAVKYSSVPVINAGDGAHHHPTQTLTDLFTLYMYRGKVSNISFGFCGDLKYGRTVHSLITTLARYPDVNYYLISPEELKLPQHIKNSVLEVNPKVTFNESYQMEEVLPNLDVLYMTRIQRERFFNEEDYLRLKDTFILDKNKVNLMKKDALIMHPLPRISEITYEVDDDPRAIYFEQAKLGMYIRMALISLMLGLNTDR